MVPFSEIVGSITLVSLTPDAVTLVSRLMNSIGIVGSMMEVVYFDCTSSNSSVHIEMILLFSPSVLDSTSKLGCKQFKLHQC